MNIHSQTSTIELTATSRHKQTHLEKSTKRKKSAELQTLPGISMTSQRVSVFVSPSPLEARFYYYGIPGTPKLVARYGSQVFDGVTDSRIDQVPDGKHITTIGQHALRQHVDNVTGDNSLSLRAEILNAIARLKWESLDFVRIGESSNAMKPTILIAVSPGSTSIADARLPLEEIWKACQKRAIYDVEIELMEAVSIEAKLESPIQFAHFKDLYQQIPLCGTSLGRMDNNEYAGTLGCYVKIDGKYAGTYILTNDHVVFPRDADRPGNADEAFNAFASSHGPIHIASPATLDNARRISILQEQYDVLDLDLDLRTCSEKYKENQYNADFLYKKTEDVRDLGYLLEVMGDALKFNLLVGNVAFASGVRKHHKDQSRLDWALIALDSNRFGTGGTRRNLFPGPSFCEELKDMNADVKELRWKFGLRKSFEPSDLHHREYIVDALNTNSDDLLRVVKCGRGTGWTWGKINEINGSCSREGDTLETEEVTVINVPKTKSERNFCSTGDSGSIVMDFRGGILGQIHSCLSAQTTGDGFCARIASMDSMIEDIKVVTGATNVGFFLKPRF